MAKITMKGEVTHEFEAEEMVIDIHFIRKSVDSAQALKAVNLQCENFLKELDCIGIPPESVIVEDAGIDYYGFDSENEMRAKKTITITVDINPQLCSYIGQLIEKDSNNLQYDIRYQLKDDSNVYKILLDEAVADSKKQAELVAESLNMRIVGVSCVNNRDYYAHNLYGAGEKVLDILNPVMPDDFHSNTPYIDRACQPRITKTQEIVIEWIMED